MSKRTLFLSATAAALVLAAAGIGIADAPSGSETPTATATPATAPPVSSPRAATADATTYQVGNAGSVAVTHDGGQLTFSSIMPAAGWLSDVEAPQGREIEVNFTNNGRRVDFNAELEDGQVRVRVRDSATDDNRDVRNNADGRRGAADDDRRGRDNDDRRHREDNDGRGDHGGNSGPGGGRDDGGRHDHGGNSGPGGGDHSGGDHNSGRDHPEDD